jgi:hypothetical protein
VKVRATRRQVDQLLAWAARFEERAWAIESAVIGTHVPANRGLLGAP